MRSNSLADPATVESSATTSPALWNEKERVRSIVSMATSSPTNESTGYVPREARNEMWRLFMMNNSRWHENLLHHRGGIGYRRAMRRIFSVESKKKLWRPCREARALGL